MTTTSSPVLVAGMHRSGTSLVAAMIASLGINMGERQLAADRNNRRCYFEDEDFLALNRPMLNACTPPDDGGHPDWGWTENELLDREGFQAFRDRLLAELGAWQERVSFMEGTRAWRLRNRLLRLRGRSLPAP